MASRRQAKAIVDLGNGGTLDDVIAEAKGSPLRIELYTGMRMERKGGNNTLKTTCQATLYTKRLTRGGAQTFVPLCMPIVGETWHEVLQPLAHLLDDKDWTDIEVATKGA